MTVDEFDVIVVGAGAAGAVVAARLSEDPATRVLVLEAGSVERDAVADRLSSVTFAKTSRDWGLTAQASPGRTLEFPQGRAAGGGSAVNMALALRPLPEDIDAWAAGGNPGWSWVDLLPSFRRLEHDPEGAALAPDVHGTGGPIPVVRWRPEEYTEQSRAFLAGCAAAGIAEVADHNDGSASGVGSFPMNRRDGERVSTAIGYLFPNADRENLVVRGGTLVDRVCIIDGRAAGVDVVDEGGRHMVRASRVVLAAGAIQSPAVLLRSGIGPAATLRALGIDVVADLAGVGENLMEHPGAFLFVVPEDGVCDTSQVQFQLGVRTTAPGSSEYNDLLLGMMNHWDLRDTPDFRDVVGADVIFALTCGVLAPRARGSVTLRSADPGVAPVIDLNLCGDPHDTARLVAALRLQHRIAQSPAMRDRIKGYAMVDAAVFDTDDDAPLAEYVRNVCAPWYHPSGTCRMGPDPAIGAVVDSSLAVHGIEGLFVADASIMPVIPRATTNLAAIAIGERAAELLR
jgi:choline dehydrogenase